MALLQDVINKVEETAGTRLFRCLPAFLAVLLVAATYDLRDYRNFSTVEAMDSAQLGRRIAEGNGYTTLFIRPLSICLIEQANQARAGGAASGRLADPALLKAGHPDISNPPVYPLFLAGLMKVLPFNFTASTTQQFWSNAGRFWRYEPEFLICLVNELLFIGVIVLTFFWARRLFDSAVAWTGSAILLGTELLWRFNVSGLSTILLMLFFMGLVGCLTRLEGAAGQPARRPLSGAGLAAAAGLLVGIGGLTRYAFGWLIIPTLIFVFFFTGPRRALLCLISFMAFAAVMSPWIVRNYQVSGTPFGTATYDVLKGSALFPGARLERSLAPNLQFFMSPIWAKLFANLRLLLNNAFTNLGGGWITGFFAVGLMVGFRSQAIRRLRYFLLMCLGLMIVVQSLGRTQLAEDSPAINSENLLVLFLPLVVIYGVSLFFTLLDQIAIPLPSLRNTVIGLFIVMACLPLILALFSGAVPMVYPPYHPLLIQQTAAWMKPEELTMSDMPWALAWYGDRQAVWLTLHAEPDPSGANAQENFFAINDYLKPIHALYLTQKTTDSRFVSDWIRAGEYGWGSFIVDVILKKEVPADFPLRQMPTGYLPEQLFLSDWKRWQ